MSEHGDRVTPKTEPSDYPLLDEHHPFNTNGGLMDQPRTPTFPGALLGIQGRYKIKKEQKKLLFFVLFIFTGLSGLMPGPSGMPNNVDSFGKLTICDCF